MLKSWKYLAVVVGLVLCVPLAMRIHWHLKPAKTSAVLMLDKTVLDDDAQEHSSFWWYLVNKKWVKPNGHLYELTRDYFGFFPKDNFEFDVHDFSHYTDTLQLDSIAAVSDVFYINDAYGIYEAEWRKQTEQTERSKKIYGGLHANDAYLAKEMKALGKPVIAEFNCFASPSYYKVRNDFQELFGLSWNGWTGRYFESLDTAVNKEIPKWLIHGYLEQHNYQWPFEESGLAFIHEDGRVEVLEDGIHLNDELPRIYPSPGTSIEELPKSIGYPFWFDQVQTTTINEVPAFYKLNTTYKGDSILRKHNILKSFPAVIEHRKTQEEPYTFYYFSGDFSDNPIKERMAKFSGIRALWPIISGNAQRERDTFFWRFYLPLLDHVFEEEAKFGTRENTEES